MAKSKKTAGMFAGAGPRTENALPQSVRDALVEGCVNLCKKVARTFARTIPGADVEDLEGEAALACVEAARFWQPEGSAKFSTFAQSYMEKRLKGLAADQRQSAALVRPEDWDPIARDADEAPEEENAGPTDDDRELLAKLDEPARTAVRLVVFERTAPDRAAEQLGMPVKDLKLVLRNAAKVLEKEKEKMGRPSLFPKPEAA